MNNSSMFSIYIDTFIKLLSLWLLRALIMLFHSLSEVLDNFSLTFFQNVTRFFQIQEWHNHQPFWSEKKNLGGQDSKRKHNLEVKKYAPELPGFFQHFPQKLSLIFRLYANTPQKLNWPKLCTTSVEKRSFFGSFFAAFS